MTDPISHQITAFTGSPTTSMSSQEIADLVESRHDNIMRTVERLVERGVIPFPPLVEKVDTGGRPGNVYNLDKRSSIIVVAQLSPEFTARIVDRWQALETKLAQLSADANTLLRLPHPEMQAVWDASLRTAQSQLLELIKKRALKSMVNALHNNLPLGGTPEQVAVAALEFCVRHAAKFQKMEQPDVRETLRQVALTTA